MARVPITGYVMTDSRHRRVLGHRVGRLREPSATGMRTHCVCIGWSGGVTDMAYLFNCGASWCDNTMARSSTFNDDVNERWDTQTLAARDADGLDG